MPVALLLHAVEEGIAAPLLLSQLAEVGSTMMGPSPALPSAGRVVGLLVLLVTASLGLLWLARRHPAAAYAMVVLQAVMTVNVFSHTAASLTMGEYTPGLVTSWVAEVPLSVVLFPRLRAEAWMSRARWIALLPLALLIHGPGLWAALWLAAQI